MIKAKKASEFSVFIVIVVIVVVLTLVIGMFGKFSRFSERVGSTQFLLMKTYEFGEKVMNYIDYSARNSFMQSFYDGSSSGFLYEEYCSDADSKNYYGYRVLNAKGKSCFPDLKEKLREGTKKSLAESLEKFSGSGVPNPDYTVSFFEEEEMCVFMYG